MEIKDLKKNTPRSIRINDKVLEKLKERGYSVQKFLDLQLETFLQVDAVIKITAKKGKKNILSK
jgi:hypothetical protein